MEAQGVLDAVDAVAVHGFPLDWNLWQLKEWPAKIKEIQAVTSLPVVSFTRAIFRWAEFGFLGVCVLTITHTPRRCGQDFKAGALVFFMCSSRMPRMS